MSENIRFGDRRTYRCCCDGISKSCVIAIGTVGCLDAEESRRYLAEGLKVVVRRLEPEAIVVYGGVPDDIFGVCRDSGILIGNDGNPIQLHHVLQKESGPMVEAREVTHKEYHRVLHGLIENGNSFRHDEDLKRQYDNFKKKYWRWRAKQILKDRNK